MISISLCMIVKDEEQTLERCLESVKNIPDEIVIVDTGSTDKTIEIAQKYTDKIYGVKWEEDFAKARNFSFAQATKEYIMWMDADDLIEEEQNSRIIILKQTLHAAIDVVLMKYHTDVDSSGRAGLAYYRERLIKNNKEMKWVEPIHEIIDLKGNIMCSDIYITHRGSSKNRERNLRIYENYLRQGNILTARGRLYYARELYENGYYKEAKQRFLQIIEEEENQQDCINACLMSTYCNKVLEEENVEVLYKSFKYASPRKDICCEIAYYFLGKEVYEKAMFWFQTVLELPEIDNGINPIEQDYIDYLPHLGLSRCYRKLRNIEKARYHNEEAGKAKPDSMLVKINRQIIEKERANGTSYLEC